MILNHISTVTRRRGIYIYRTMTTYRVSNTIEGLLTSVIRNKSRYDRHSYPVSDETILVEFKDDLTKKKIEELKGLIPEHFI